MRQHSPTAGDIGGMQAMTPTRPNEVNLGKPPWNNPSTRVPTPNGPEAPATSETDHSSSP